MHQAELATLSCSNKQLENLSGLKTTVYFYSCFLCIFLTKEHFMVVSQGLGLMKVSFDTGFYDWRIGEKNITDKHEGS